MSDHIGDAGSRNAERIRELEIKLLVMTQRKEEWLKSATEYRDKLAIAAEALEEIDASGQSCNDMMCTACATASEALAKIQSR